jgi:hypothetical protein
MKWIEKNWVVILILVVAYLWYTGGLATILGGAASGSSSAIGPQGQTVTYSG